MTVINHSAAWVWDGPGDGTSPDSSSPLTTINSTVSGGAIWINAAGNSAETSWQGGYADADSDGWLEFTTNTEFNGVFLTAGEKLTVQMRWSDIWGASNRDLDLWLTDLDIVDLAWSQEVQLGSTGDEPYESFNFVAPATGEYLLWMEHYDGPAPSWIQVNAFTGQDLEFATANNSMGSPADSANLGMLAVGASNWVTPTVIESFSGQGPTTDGRVKPDIVGADRGDSASYGAGGFLGTSQASPHVAGLAALVLQQLPSFTPAQVAAYLKDNALPRGAAPNNTWGYGLAQLPSLAPGAPTGIAAVRGLHEAAVSWSAPSADGGSPVTHFTVTSSPGEITAVATATSTSIAVTGLTAGIPYTFTVTATNAVGTGASSTPSNAVTPVDVPGAPLNVAATRGNGQVTVTWTAPAGDGGDPITTYTVTSNPGAKTASTTAAVLTAVVSGLVNGTEYTFTVRATNAFGTGAGSAQSDPATPATLPDPPTNVTALGGNEQALVSWQAPVSDGGDTISQYTVTSSPDALTGASSPGDLFAWVLGLDAETSYTFVVTAANGIGTSSPSAPSNSIVPGNFSPVVIAPNTNFSEGSAEIRQVATFTDVETAQTRTATIDWGDGSTSTGIVVESNGAGTVSGSHVYTDDSVHTVTVTVNDGFGGVGSDSLTLTVDNAPPTVLISSLRSESDGRIGLWPATYTDPGALDTHTGMIDWGDGTTTTATLIADKRAVLGSHTYNDAGNYTVTVTVTDDDGGSGSDTFAMAIDATPIVVAIPSIGAWGLLLLTLVLALGLLVRTRVSNRSA